VQWDLDSSWNNDTDYCTWLDNLNGTRHCHLRYGIGYQRREREQRRQSVMVRKVRVTAYQTTKVQAGSEVVTTKRTVLTKERRLSEIIV
jgi:hypothetical protein